MNTDVKELTIFQPISITITFQSQKEIIGFKHLLQCASLPAICPWKEDAIIVKKELFRQLSTILKG